MKQITTGNATDTSTSSPSPPGTTVSPLISFLLLFPDRDKIVDLLSTRVSNAVDRGGGVSCILLLDHVLYVEAIQIRSETYQNLLRMTSWWENVL